MPKENKFEQREVFSMSHSGIQTYIANQSAINIGRYRIGDILKEKWLKLLMTKILNNKRITSKTKGYFNKIFSHY